MSSVEERLKTLVAYRSTTDNQAEVKALLDDAEQQLGVTPMIVKRYEHNGVHSLVATSRETMSPKVWLVAHVDVVAAKDEMFTVQVTDDRLVGRGVTDDKFAAASFIEAAVQLGESVAEHDFGIMLTGDEETSGLDGVGYLVNKVGYRGDVAFLPDGGFNWQIELQAKGGIRYQLEADGVTAHGSRPWLGENAIEKMLRFVGRLREELRIPSLEEAKAEYNSKTFNLGVIKGGEAANQVPAHAEAVIDIRFVRDEELEEIRVAIAKVASEMGIDAREVTHLTPVNNDKNNPWIQKFAQILESEGIAPGYTRSYGGTDARFFAQHGASLLVSQPDGGNLHADGEWISRKGLDEMVAVTKKLIQES